jgi:hypothetical protein
VPVPPFNRLFVNDPEPIQLPLTAKQPVVRFIPFAKVDDAIVLVIFNRLDCIPPANVDVADVVAVKYEPTICPTTDKGAYGEVVPTPRFPEKYDLAVVVDIKLPTVSCVPVAIRAPEPSVATIEFAAPVNDVPLIVTVVTDPESEATTPPPTKFIVVLVARAPPSSCIREYPPLPIPRQTPFTDTHPPETAIPPAYVEVDVLETVRFVKVVVPRLAELADIDPALILVLFIEPPFIVGLFITVFVNWSILWLCAIC